MKARKRQRNCKIIPAAIQLNVLRRIEKYIGMQRRPLNARRWVSDARMIGRKCSRGLQRKRKLIFARKPEIRRRAGKFYGNVRFASRALARLYHAAFALGLVEHVYEK